MSSQNDSGLMSSAGLVRYFDSENSNAIFIKARTVAAVSVLFGVLILLLNIFVTPA